MIIKENKLNNFLLKKVIFIKLRPFKEMYKRLGYIKNKCLQPSYIVEFNDITKKIGIIKIK